MTKEMSAAWRKMVGIALLWTALSTIVYLATAVPSTKSLVVGLLGFISFSFGAALLTDGMKREILAGCKRR